MRIKKIFLIITIFLLSLSVACNKNIDNENDITKSDNTQTIIDTNKENDHDLITGNGYNSDYLYTQFQLFDGDKEIPVLNCKTNFSHTFNGEAPSRMNNGVAIIGLRGSVTLRLVSIFNLNNICTIRPLAKNVQYSINNDNNTIEFVIKEKGFYTVELSNNRTLHLFVNEYMEYDDLKDKATIYFGPGVHNKDNSNYINSSNTITLNNNDFVYIDRGAIVEGKFLCNNKSNVRIVGEGVVSGATFTRSVNQGKALIPYDFNYCNNIAIEGIVTLDPAGWCYNMYFCNDLTIDNVKIITSRANGDGISIQSCNNVKVTNSFVRSWDDSLVVKNYPMWSNRDNEGSSSNILFDNCVIWTDLAQSMEIGYETIGEIMKDITFSNITILHNYHKACISIHNGNNANIENVHYKNIIIEDASMGKGDGRNVLIEITTEFSSTWSTNHKTTSLGSINDVLIEDVYCYNANNPLISLRGSIDGRSGYSKDIHYVSNITFKNVYINDELLSNNYDNFESIYCENIIFQE